jgi:hypothetical protein
MAAQPIHRYKGTAAVILLAILLMFGSEILVWTNPPGRLFWEWLLLIPGYLALSVVLLDFTIRYRIRDLFGALILTGIFGLASALILNPASTLNDLPRTLFTRVMGAHALIAAEMIGLFLAITGKAENRRNLLIGSVIVGLAWGIWVKNWPIEEGYGAVSLPVMLAFGAGGILLIGLYLYVILPRLQVDSPVASSALTTSADDPLTILLLDRRGWFIVSGVLGALLVVRLLQGEVIGAGLILCPLLLALCWAIIWFRGRKRGDTLLDQRLPIQPIALPSLLLAAAVFLTLGIFGYNLPDIKLGSVTPFTLIGLGFTAYGLAWLPTVSLVLGIQGYLRQLATRKM